MKLTVSTVALILALASAQVGAIPAPQTTHVGHPHEESHTYHRGGLSGGRPAHGPEPDEEESHLVRRINYIQHPSANWKWWQKQGNNKMIGGGNPNVRVIDVKNDALGERLDWKRDVVTELENQAHQGEAVLGGQGGAQDKWISVPVSKED